MKKLLVISSLIASAFNAYAQDYKGIVVNPDNQPLPFANVVLMTMPDSTFICGNVTDMDGKFDIKCEKKADAIRISSIGYKTSFINNPSENLGPIAMESEDTKIDEIEIKAQKPKTKLTGNSMVTSIEGSVLEKSGTAKEMLSKVPGMTQNGDELEVIGKGAPVFYINGRKMQDKDELKRLRSEDIKDVEVITNPGAQYDATVTSVVRIKTVKRQGNGFGFDLNASNSQDLRYGYTDPNTTLNLKYRHNNTDLFGMVNYWEWATVNYNLPKQQSYMMNKGGLVNIEQDMFLRDDNKSKVLNYNIGFNTDITENHSVGMRIEYHDKIKSSEVMHQIADIDMKLDNVTIQSEKSVTWQYGKDKQPYSWEGNAYYNGRIGKMSIDFNLDFMANKSSNTTNIGDMQNFESYDMQNQSNTKHEMIASKLVFSYPIGNGMLQAGTEMTRVNRDSRYILNRYYDNNINVPNTNSFVEENNVAVFASYAFSHAKLGSMIAGVRFEHVGFDYKDLWEANNSMNRYTNDIFPTASWAKQWGAWQTSLSYSFKTSRPNYWMLNEATTVINPYSLQSGDPKLKNARIQEIGASVRWSWLTFFTAYERQDDALTQWSYIYNDEGVILIKNINMDVPMRNLAFFLSASPTWGCYTPNWTIGVQKFNVKQTLADPREETQTRDVEYKKPITFFRLNNTVRLKKSWQFECYMGMNTSGDVMNYRLNNVSCDLSLTAQKCWLKNDALCLRAKVGDILQKNYQNIVMDCGYYELNQNSRSNQHRLEVSLRYSFNASQNKYKGTGAGSDAKSRL